MWASFWFRTLLSKHFRRDAAVMSLFASLHFTHEVKKLQWVCLNILGVSFEGQVFRVREKLFSATGELLLAGIIVLMETIWIFFYYYFIFPFPSFWSLGTKIPLVMSLLSSKWGQTNNLFFFSSLFTIDINFYPMIDFKEEKKITAPMFFIPIHSPFSSTCSFFQAVKRERLTRKSDCGRGFLV